MERDPCGRWTQLVSTNGASERFIILNLLTVLGGADEGDVILSEAKNPPLSGTDSSADGLRMTFRPLGLDWLPLPTRLASVAPEVFAHRAEQAGVDHLMIGIADDAERIEPLLHALYLPAQHL